MRPVLEKSARSNSKNTDLEEEVTQHVADKQDRDPTEDRTLRERTDRTESSHVDDLAMGTARPVVERRRVAKAEGREELTPPSRTPPKYKRIRSTSVSSMQTLLEPPTTMPSLPLQKITKVLDIKDLWNKRQQDRSFTAQSRSDHRAGPGFSEVANETPRGYPKAKGYVTALLDQEEFDKLYGFRRVDLSISSRVYRYLAEVRRWSCMQWLYFLRNCVPITNWLATYDWKHYFFTDFVGGLMLAIMCIPQGLAYGFLIGLKPTHGLYTCIVGPLIYAMLGTSKHTSPGMSAEVVMRVIQGAFAIIALMVGSAVQQANQNHKTTQESNFGHGNFTPLCCAGGGESEKLPQEVVIHTVACLTLCVGLIQVTLAVHNNIVQIAFGVLNLGVLAVWMSDHLVQGLTSGAAIHVLTSQLKSMTGVENVPKTSDIAGIVKFYTCFFFNINTVKLSTLVASMAVCGTLIVSKEFLDPIFSRWLKIKFPMEFLVVLFSILLCYFSANTPYDLGLQVVGKVESGMMAPFAPNVKYVTDVVYSAVSVAVISFVIHVALAKLVSKKMNYHIDANQEWFALGSMHLVSAFFGCFAGGSSLSRTLTAVKLGTKTQMSTIICAIVLIITVYCAAHLLYYLPQPVLACIVVVALKDLFLEIGTATKLMKKSLCDFLIWFVTFMAVVLLNVNWGLLIGVVFALLTVVFRSQWAESTCMGRIPNTPDFKGLDHYREAVEVPGIRVFRFDAPLYFANAELFLRRLHSALGIDPVMAYEKLREEEIKQEDSLKDLATPALPSEPESTRDIELDVKPTIANSMEITKADDVTHKANRGSDDEREFIHLSHFVIDCSSFPYIDIMGLDALTQAYEDLEHMGVRVFLSNCKVAVRQFFEENDFYKRVPKNNLFTSVATAVVRAQYEREQQQNQDRENRMKSVLPANVK